MEPSLHTVSITDKLTIDGIFEEYGGISDEAFLNLLTISRVDKDQIDNVISVRAMKIKGIMPDVRTEIDKILLLIDEEGGVERILDYLSSMKS